MTIINRDAWLVLVVVAVSQSIPGTWGAMMVVVLQVIFNVIIASLNITTSWSTSLSPLDSQCGRKKLDRGMDRCAGRHCKFPLQFCGDLWGQVSPSPVYHLVLNTCESKLIFLFRLTDRFHGHMKATVMVLLSARSAILSMFSINLYLQWPRIYFVDTRVY